MLTDCVIEFQKKLFRWSGLRTASPAHGLHVIDQLDSSSQLNTPRQMGRPEVDLIENTCEILS